MDEFSDLFGAGDDPLGLPPLPEIDENNKLEFWNVGDTDLNFDLLGSLFGEDQQNGMATKGTTNVATHSVAHATGQFFPSDDEDPFRLNPRATTCPNPSGIPPREKDRVLALSVKEPRGSSGAGPSSDAALTPRDTPRGAMPTFSGGVGDAPRGHTPPGGHWTAPGPAILGNKPRLRWTPELHDKFVAACTQLGGPDKATPKGILTLMEVDQLTIFHIKSHLQKYRISVQEAQGGVPSMSGMTDDDDGTEATEPPRPLQRGGSAAARRPPKSASRNRLPSQTETGATAALNVPAPLTAPLGASDSGTDLDLPRGGSPPGGCSPLGSSPVGGSSPDMDATWAHLDSDRAGTSLQVQGASPPWGPHLQLSATSMQQLQLQGRSPAAAPQLALPPTALGADLAALLRPGLPALSIVTPATAPDLGAHVPSARTLPSAAPSDVPAAAAGPSSAAAAAPEDPLARELDRALRSQMDLQKHLYEQLEVQRQIQFQLDRQNRYVQTLIQQSTLQQVIKQGAGAGPSVAAAPPQQQIDLATLQRLQALQVLRQAQAQTPRPSDQQQALQAVLIQAALRKQLLLQQALAGQSQPPETQPPQHEGDEREAKRPRN